jgi:hypothetical protein
MTAVVNLATKRVKKADLETRRLEEIRKVRVQAQKEFLGTRRIIEAAIVGMTFVVMLALEYIEDGPNRWIFQFGVLVVMAWAVGKVHRKQGLLDSHMFVYTDCLEHGLCGTCREEVEHRATCEDNPCWRHRTRDVQWN